MTNPHVQTGYRFMLRHDVDRFPNFVAKQGMTGTVILLQADGLVAARMDQFIPGAEGWDNERWWSDGVADFLEDTSPHNSTGAG